MRTCAMSRNVVIILIVILAIVALPLLIFAFNIIGAALGLVFGLIGFVFRFLIPIVVIAAIIWLIFRAKK
jgi:heme/copper-type cytochrome/quinol oxidase subunit 4